MFSDHTPTIITEATNLRSHAQMLHLDLQSTSASLSGKLSLFEDNLQSERERFLDELSDVEQWLSNVYDVLRREPVRDHVTSYTTDEVRELQEEYSEEGVNVGGGGLTLLEQVELGEGAETYGVHREVSISGSSLGSDLLDVAVGQEILDTSVDVELEDEEYEKRVLERVLSPSPVAEGDDDPIGNPSDPFDDPDNPVGEQWAESMEEEEEEEGTDQAETGSVSSVSTLREDPNKSPDTRFAAAEFSEEEVNPGDVGEGVTSEVGEEVRGKSLADELGELGIELEEEISDKGVKTEEEEEADGGGLLFWSIFSQFNFFRFFCRW